MINRIPVSFLFSRLRNPTSLPKAWGVRQMSQATSYPGKPITNANPAPPTDKICVTINTDSGAGGAACQADSFQYLQQRLLDISAHHHVQFQIHHLGDAHNAPFGSKTPSEILGLTKALIREGTHTYGASRVAIACNTASTTDGPDLRDWIEKNVPGTEVFSIIKPTAKELYSKGSYFSGRREGNEKHIAVLSTLATAKSGLYPLELAGLHYEKWGAHCITVVKSNIDVPEFPRVFEGQMPIPRDSPEEAKLLKQVADNSSQYPVLVVHTYAPPDWVSLLEGKTPGKTDADLTQEVMGDMAKFFKQIGADLPTVHVLGLCCTHYPLVKDQIKLAFSARENQKYGVKVTLTETMEIVSQGKIVAEQLLLPSIQSALERGDFPRREQMAWNQQIKLMSWTTGYKNDPSSIQSLRVVKSLFEKCGGELAQTRCEIVSPYSTVK